MSEGFTILTHIGEGADELLAASERNVEIAASRSFTAYAPPLVWGPGMTVASHIGAVTYRITYEAIGDTLVMGRVHYYKSGSQDKVTEEFSSSTTITTSNSVGNVVVDFKGIPTGSAVNGTISP